MVGARREWALCRLEATGVCVMDGADSPPYSTESFDTKGSIRMRTWKSMVAGSVAGALLFIASGCAYTHVQMPLGTNFNSTQFGTKEGRSNSYSVLWLIAWGDAGTKAAATQGNIKVIRYADHEVKSVLLGLYSRVTTIVYGD